MQATALDTVIAILNSTRSTDIPALVQALDPSEQVRLVLSALVAPWCLVRTE